MKDKLVAGDHLFLEFSESQRQAYRNLVAAHQAYREAWQQLRVHKGGMHWKKIRGRQYLYRYRDRYGHGGSLGRRSPQTEQLFADFTRERQESRARCRERWRHLAEQARFCRASRLPRLPGAAAKILRGLEEREPGVQLRVIGSAALYAYLFAAGVVLAGAGLLDLWGEARHRLTLAGEMSADDLLRLLRRADRSFAQLPGADCRAANRDGFQVRLLKGGLKQPGKPRVVIVPGAREPLPLEAGQLQYLVAAPPLSQVVIGPDGGPATMVVPDPRAFALHRLWWSQREDRDAGKRARDLDQALVVASLVLRHLPQYDLSSPELDMFPQVRDRAAMAWGDPEGALRGGD
jgi:hypothetical protein